MNSCARRGGDLRGEVRAAASRRKAARFDERVAAMAWLRWVAAVLALVQGGYMLFDGMRALLVGDYLTPSGGKYAGRLGPWAGLVSAVGVDPRSTAMKLAFVLYGVAWIAVLAGFVARRPWAWTAMLVLAAATLWYVPAGTAIGLAVIGILLLRDVRESF